MTTVGSVKKDFRKSLWVLGAFSLLTNLLVLAQPLYMLQVYDRVLPSQSTATLLFLTLAVAFSLLILGLLEIVRSIIANRAAARFDVGLSDLAMRTVIATNSSGGGGNAQPLRDIALLRSLIASKVLFGVLDLPFATIFIAIMYLIHPSLFWLTLCGAAVLTLIAIFNQWALGPPTKDHGDHAVAAGQRAEYLARTAGSLIAMGMVSNVVNRSGDVHAHSLAAADKAAQLNAWFAGLSRVLRVGLQIAILGYGALLVLESEITAGMIFAASLISGARCNRSIRLSAHGGSLPPGARRGSAPTPSWTRPTSANNTLPFRPPWGS